MSAFLNYALEANLGMGLFLAVYFFLFRNENDFAAKRFYLLGSLGISLIIPLLHISSSTSGFIPSVGMAVPSNWLPEIVVWSGTTSVDSLSVWQWILLAYFMVALAFLVRMVRELFNLNQFIRAASGKLIGKFWVIETTRDLTAFSFFHYIVLGKGPFSMEERNLIIEHESIHARRLHSIDVLFLQTLIALFWYNPCVYLYKKILCEIHEFEADSLTLPASQQSVYSGLLARTALGKIHFPLAHHLNNSITIKRLAMLSSFKKRINSWKWFASGMAALALFLVVACQDQVKSTGEGSSGNLPTAKTDEVYTIVEEVATPIDGMTSYYKFIAEHLKYPEQARKMGVEGKVLVEFVVQKDGSISDLKVLQGVGAGCDAEAINVISAAPKWKPGMQRGEPVAMKMVVPILFKLGDGTALNSKSEPIEVRGEDLFCSVGVTRSNGKTILEGKLTDQSGAPVRNVNIVLKNTNQGTFSSSDGTFRFETSATTGSLVMSHGSFKVIEKVFGGTD